MASAILKCFLVCLALIYVSNGKVIVEQLAKGCFIDTRVTIFAKPIETGKDPKYRDCYHVRTVTVFRFTGFLDVKTHLSSVAIPLANLLEIGQDEIHDCGDKMRISETYAVVIIKSCFYADIKRLKEKLDLNKDDIWNSLVKRSDCWVKKHPKMKLFLLEERGAKNRLLKG